MIRSVSFIGAGNVASQLAIAFYNKGIKIDQICSKTESSAKTLAGKVNAQTVVLNELNNNSDLYIISVNDDAIGKVIENLKLNSSLIVHTSGTVPMDSLATVSTRTGVFYPLQTFSKDKPVDFNSIPICIEAANHHDLDLLITLGKTISNNVQHISSEQRKKIHLAAVFACNFTNHFYAIAEDILQKDNMSLDILKPLILETAQKINTISPKKAQTGPAVRNDLKIIEEQLNQLKDIPEYQNLYKFVTQSIQRNHE